MEIVSSSAGGTMFARGYASAGVAAAVFGVGMSRVESDNWVIASAMKRYFIFETK